MEILVDTREQRPLNFKKFTRTTLNVGDYTTKKLIHCFVAERKSPQDLYQSIIQNHMRFRRMLTRAEDKGITVVMYVECSKTKFINKKWKGGSQRKIKSHVLEKIVNTLSSRYNLEFVWCVNRTSMAKKIYARLLNETNK